MSWFKRESPLRASFGRRSSYSPPQLPDVTTCLEAFHMHWQQAWAVMEKIYQNPQFVPPSVDDVTSVTNHVDQMVTLLLQEIVAIQQAQGQEGLLNSSVSCKEQQVDSPILSVVLTEGILDKLYAWSVLTGEYMDVLKIEQLKHYERLVSHSPQNLFHKPIVRPLLGLLASCGECSPVDVEKRLVLLLNTLCVCLTRYPDLLKVFFDATPEHGSARFLIFSLLILFVHREGAIGQQARDALLLCMALSRRNESIGMYIAEHSNFCPVLATGLSGLYSLLPRKLPLVSEDWYRFTSEDIQEMAELAMFLNSLEFCNAVIQVSHPMVQEQLLEYLYQGFLLPVLGPALHQSTAEEIIASTAYLELFLRTVTEPTLLQVFLKFLLTESYEGHKILDTLISRIGAQSKLCLVTMAFFWTLLDLNCEDVMLELILKYLISCTHIMVSQKTRIRDLDLYGSAAEKFLSLIPSCCITDSSIAEGFNMAANDSTFEKITRGGSLRIKKHSRTPSTGSFALGDFDSFNHLQSSAAGILHPLKLEHFQTSYMDYLKEARHKIILCFRSCKCWSAPYNGIDPSPECAQYNMDMQGKFSLIRNGHFQPTADVNSRNSTGFFLPKSSSAPVDIHSHFYNTDDAKAIRSDSGQRIELEYCNDYVHSEFANGRLDDSIHNQNSKQRPNSLEIKRDFSFNHDLYHLASIDDDQAFWSAVNSTKTPSSVSDNDDILEAYETGMINTSPADSTITDAFIREDISIADSGAYMSQESNNSSLDRASDVAQTFEKLIQHKEDAPDTSKPSTSSKDETATHPSVNLKSNYSSTWEPFGSPDIGPFLSILLTRLEMMIQNDVYINLHLTGLFTRLAIYPQPLLRSFLLNHTLVFQPSIRSLLQVLVSLKQKVDSHSCTVENFEELLVKARQFLLAREERLLGDGPPRIYSETVKKRSNSDLQRGEHRRRSFTSKLFRRSVLFSDKERASPKHPVLESIPDGQGYRYISKPSPDAVEGKLETIKTKNAVLCAVVLEEFLKELAAITQEHGVIQLDPEFWDTRWEV